MSAIVAVKRQMSGPPISVAAGLIPKIAPIYPHLSTENMGIFIRKAAREGCQPN